MKLYHGSNQWAFCTERAVKHLHGQEKIQEN